MALGSPHNEWRLPKANPLEVRAVGLDEVLTRLWLRVTYENRRLIRRAGGASTIAELAARIARPDNPNFRGFADAPEAAAAWLRADLVKPLQRSPDHFSVARPLHALATRLRSS